MSDNAAARAIRLLDLVPYVLNHPGISIRDLAADFDISKEEMIKDLNLLFMCGLPGYTPLELIDISFDDDVVVVRDPQNLKVPRKLTESESLAVRIALATLEEITVASDESRRKIAHLRKKLSRAFNSNVPDSAINVSVDHEKLVLSKIKEAIETFRDAEITYISVSKDQSSQRLITPHSIIFDGNRTLIDAYCHKAQSRRTFNLSHIATIALVSRIEVSPATDISETQGSTVDIKITNPTCEFFKANETSLTSLSSQLFQMQIFQPQWLVRSVISEATNLELIAPVSLRSAISANASTALKNYRE